MNNRKNIDFYRANKDLAHNVLSFWTCSLNRAAISEEYLRKILHEREEVKKWEALIVEGGCKSYSLEDCKKALAKVEERIAELEDEKARYLEEAERWSYTPAEKMLSSSLKKSKSKEDVKRAFVEYFGAYNLNIEGSAFLEAILFKCYHESTSIRKYATSGGTRTLVVNANGTLKAMVSMTFETLVSVGTIKPVALPSILREKYVKEKKNNK